MQIDHVMYGVRDLEEARSRFQHSYGLTAVSGGVHPDAGTANVILPVGNDQYVELITVVDPQPEHPLARAIACAHDLAGTDRALILGYGIYPQNPHARFPAVTITVATRSGKPMYAVDSGDSVHTTCHPVVDLKLRALAAGEQFGDLGALPAFPASSLVTVVTVDGKTVTVPLRPMCHNGETQSVHGCVYDPIHWNDQPGFPTIDIGATG